MVVVLSKWPLLVHLNVISIFNCKHHYRSHVFRYMLEKKTESESSLTLGKFYHIVEKVGKFTFSKYLAEKSLPNEWQPIEQVINCCKNKTEWVQFGKLQMITQNCQTFLLYGIYFVYMSCILHVVSFYFAKATYKAK